MIPVSATPCQASAPEEPSWQSLLQNAINDPRVLCQQLDLDPLATQGILDACRAFPLRVPQPYLSLMQRGNPRDPLLLQVLPQATELETRDGFIPDPLAEQSCNPLPGLIHKYASRVLLVTTSLCAVHCRYCFRREFPYADNRNSRQDWERALDYIRSRPAVNEVILSGGDPMALPDRQLAWLVERLAAIPHLQRLRLHTRLPVVIPQRITAECLSWLTGSRLQPVVVIHANHPREIGTDVSAALQTLRQHGVTVLNQSVLLAGINDDPETLAALSEALFAAGCLPYYLHTLDPVRGSHHFAIHDDAARAIHSALQALLPGFLVPRLVREVPGEPAKTWLS